MVASVDLNLRGMSVCQHIERDTFDIMVLGKNVKSIVGYQFRYHIKPSYVYKDEKMFMTFFTKPIKRVKAKVLYQDNILMVNVFGRTNTFSVVLKNKFWV